MYPQKIGMYRSFLSLSNPLKNIKKLEKSTFKQKRKPQVLVGRNSNSHLKTTVAVNHCTHDLLREQLNINEKMKKV